MTATAEKPKVKPSIHVEPEQILDKACPEIPGLTRKVKPLFTKGDASYFRVNFEADTPMGRAICIKSAFVIVADGQAKVDFEKEVKPPEDWSRRA